MDGLIVVTWIDCDDSNGQIGICVCMCVCGDSNILFVHILNTKKIEEEKTTQNTNCEECSFEVHVLL